MSFQRVLQVAHLALTLAVDDAVDLLDERHVRSALANLVGPFRSWALVPDQVHDSENRSFSSESLMAAAPPTPKDENGGGPSLVATSARLRRQAVRRLQDLGYQVTIEPRTDAA